MKKTMVIGLVAVVGLLLGGVAYACWWGGYGMPYGASSNSQMLKFQKETLGLRDELAAKELELQNEYDKPAPDANRVATLQREIDDLEAKIGRVSDRYGMSRWDRTGYGLRGCGMYGCSWDRMDYGYRGHNMHGCW